MSTRQIKVLSLLTGFSTLLFTVQAANTNVEVEKPEVIKQHLRIANNAEKWMTSDNNFLLHIRCKITTRQRRITMGAANGKLKDSDLVAFENFRLTFPDKTTITASGLGHTLLGEVFLYRAPEEYGNLINFNDLKRYVWDVDVVFVLPKGTRSAFFQFDENKPISIAIPVEIE